jgi:hypothetical protein
MTGSFISDNEEIFYWANPQDVQQEHREDTIAPGSWRNYVQIDLAQEKRDAKIAGAMDGGGIMIINSEAQ